MVFSTDIYGLCKISEIIFGVHFQNSECTGMHKESQYVAAYGGKVFKMNFDKVIVHKIQ